MTYFYIVASLPFLRLGEKPEVEPDAWYGQVEPRLRESDRHEVRCMLQGRPEDGYSAGCRACARDEVQLRNAIVRMRARDRDADLADHERRHEGFDVLIEKRVADAWAKPDPLEREKELDRCRWELLEETARADVFGLGRILAFAGQLELAWRWVRWDDSAGRQKLEGIVNGLMAGGDESSGSETDEDRL